MIQDVFYVSGSILFCLYIVNYVLKVFTKYLQAEKMQRLRGETAAILSKFPRGDARDAAVKLMDVANTPEQLETMKNRLSGILSQVAPQGDKK